MLRPPPRSTRTDTLFPYTTLFRSQAGPPENGALRIGLGEDVGPVRHAEQRAVHCISAQPRHAVEEIALQNKPLEGVRLHPWPFKIADDRHVESVRVDRADVPPLLTVRSEEHTSELQSLMRISYAVFCLKKTHTSINNSTCTIT